MALLGSTQEESRLASDTKSVGGEGPQPLINSVAEGDVTKGHCEDVLSLTDLKLREKNDFSLTLDKLSVSKGDTLAIVGSNGSGKTTLVESVLGLRSLDSGHIKIMGVDWGNNSESRQVKVRLGLQLQNSSYPRNYKVTDIISLHATVYQLEKESLPNIFNVASLRNKTYKKLSRGERQRVDLYTSLAHDPELIFLDEPGTGLDQHYLKEFYGILSQRRKCADKTTVMCTHTGEELMLCTAILWLNQGNKVLFKSVPRTRDGSVLEEKIQFSYKAVDKETVFSSLDKFSGEISYVGEEVLGHGVVFGNNLQEVRRFLESSSLIADHATAKSDGYDFLKIVSNK